ncbi:replication initiation protein [Gordonia phage Sidious]|uniref:Helix-turn-helix DNA binding domain protein n=1 Tax=Gordonia phage Sidious TaxID=2591118 RepID=A0A515MIC1_9CAUD|nr:replication initiation protein [Gordonia phage Sidious]QDM56416.1 helix-turn-helix DNA binding domain protein [Gordonia phage Sidious]
MRIRSTKPEFWRSHRIASVSWDARLVLKGLESFVDDNGVGKDDIELIIGDLFQRDLIREPSRTLARVSEAISELHQAGLVWRYDHNGTSLLYVAFWESIQRVDKPQPGRLPRPDGTLNYKDSQIRECVASPREDSRNVAPGTGEQRNRGTGEQGIPPAVPEVTHQGSREVAQRGTRASRRIADLNATSRSADADRFAAEFNRWAGGGIPVQARIEIAQEVDQLIADGISPHQIAEGVKAWHASDRLYASQIPAFVTKAARSAEPQPKATKATLRAVDTLAATEALIAEFRESA